MLGYELNPLVDPRWEQLVSRDTQSSAFHTVGWIRALQRTYKYDPIVVTTSPSGSRLENGILFCKVRSYLTGTRLVSLPFSDHCEPLGQPNDITDLLRMITRGADRQAPPRVQIRPLSRRTNLEKETGFYLGQRFYLHRLDLRPELDVIFNGFHKDCIQRKIRRAEREELQYREGRSKDLLKDFYGLFLITRRRHGLPPQPQTWFANLLECLGGGVELRLAYKDSRPLAGIVTLSHRDCMVYKYGCSDPASNKLGGMALLFWKAIQDAKRRSMVTLDLGRSDLDATGLITFKEHIGARRQELTYADYPVRPSHVTWKGRLATTVFRHLPDPLLVGAGRFLYKHVG
jgi:CelD/BcsL family acetyltransferase involved in cellulose biosynthesis